MMTQVFGTLFEDGRDGFLVIKPSKPFFGCSKHEKRFPVTGGSVDIQLEPTPPGIHYLVAFKDPGDFTRTDFNLKWRVPAVEQLDISPTKPKAKESTPAPGSISNQVQLKRLASELASTLQQVAELQQELNQTQSRLNDVTSKFEVYKLTTEKVLSSKDAAYTSLQESEEPEIRTVYKSVPVPAAP